MGYSRTFFLPLAVVFFLALMCTSAWAGGKIAVVNYELKPVETVDAGRYIKAEWNAKIRNRASETVNFNIEINFIDSNSEVLKTVSKECELSAQQTKTFTDTVLLEEAIARKVATTKVELEETTGESSAQ